MIVQTWNMKAQEVNISYWIRKQRSIIKIGNPLLKLSQNTDGLSVEEIELPLAK